MQGQVADGVPLAIKVKNAVYQPVRRRAVGFAGGKTRVGAVAQLENERAQNFPLQPARE